MLDSFLRQVAKDSYGPVKLAGSSGLPCVVHRFNDSYTVEGWGKMPDSIRDRGRINAAVFSLLNRRYLSRDSWKAFLRSPDALSFRKAGGSIPQAGTVSSMLNGISESLPLASNYLGLLSEGAFKALDSNAPLSSSDLTGPIGFSEGATVFPVCAFYQEERAPVSTVMGRAVWDRSVWTRQAGPKLLPFEILCHYSLTESSCSALNTSQISIPKTSALHTLQPGVRWDFPVVELLASNDPFQKRLGLSEALWVTGFSPEKLQELILSATWISSWAAFELKQAGVGLDSIQLRFATDASGGFVLVDAFGLDDLGIQYQGVRAGFETAIEYLQKTVWFDSVLRAKKQALQSGGAEWKKLCVEPAPVLDLKVKERVEEEYRKIGNAILGSLSDVLQG
jgi:phosphoribosylaminoimidazole-succinocarboxamide synthase